VENLGLQAQPDLLVQLAKMGHLDPLGHLEVQGQQEQPVTLDQVDQAEREAILDHKELRVILG
jgi:hypothetical protein